MTTPRVELPDHGDGSRRDRRAARNRRPRPTAPRWLLPAIGIAIVVALIGWGVTVLLDDDEEPTAPPSDDASGDAGPPPALVLLQDGDGEVYGVAILAPARDAIIHVPPGTMVEVPSLDLAPVRDAARDGGIELVRHSLENLLGVRFSAAVALDPAALAAVVGQPLTIVVAQAVEERADNGRVSVVVPAGSQTVAPDDLVGVLRPVGNGTSLERIVRHQAFWDAYLATDGAAAPTALETGVAVAVEALATSTVRHHVLPVESVGGVSGDDELFRVDDGALADLVERLLPGASPPDQRVRVRILNGAGAPAIAQRVQPLLIDVGGEVTLSGNADRFDYQTTQVVYYDDIHLDDANAIREAIGVGEVVKSLSPLDVVDVTIVVGADFLAAHGG